LDNKPPLNDYIVRPIGERVAALEVRMEQMEITLDQIDKKLDDLLSLKHQGLGALGLVSILVGSGFLGLMAMLTHFFGLAH
jgi:hypothetical protein